MCVFQRQHIVTTPLFLNLTFNLHVKIVIRMSEQSSHDIAQFIFGNPIISTEPYYDLFTRFRTYCLTLCYRVYSIKHFFKESEYSWPINVTTQNQTREESINVIKATDLGDLRTVSARKRLRRTDRKKCRFRDKKGPVAVASQNMVEASRAR